MKPSQASSLTNHTLAGFAVALAALAAAACLDTATRQCGQSGLRCPLDHECLATISGFRCIKIESDCGDGFEDPELGEVCDDGNNINGDGCSADCRSDETCGNNVVDVDETCDDGNTQSGDGCNAACLSEADCGDNQVQPGEQCDEGDQDSEFCDSDCTIAVCGDGHVNREFDPDFAEGPLSGEECDDGDNSASCDADCSLPSCGDGFVNPHFNPDPTGQLPITGEQCDTAGNSATCDSDCTAAICGDGFVNPNFDPDGEGPARGEECDPPDLECGEGTGCDLDCTRC